MRSEQNSILMEIPARIVSVGGPVVHRLLPYAKKRMVGPFIFFDHFPTTDFSAGEGLEVRPHPHIGLSTLSYLLEGEVLHHDSLGNRQVLRPGDINWMTAGNGISHSERNPESLRGKKHRLHLLQFWVALPLNKEDCDPSFTHHPSSSIPRFSIDGADVILVAGRAFGHESPVPVHSSLFFMDVHLKKDQTFTFNPQNQELALFVLQGSVRLSEQEVLPDHFVVLEENSSLFVKAQEDAQFVVLGGEPFPESRHIYWNFVSSSKDKIEKAKTAWMNGSFPQVPGETDVIPLPATEK